ncbi:MAG: hypothetical protein GXP50_13060 [Deltaproteobacteria bacterium]|nr:hypothetical protein [Deltaproteobacteria bacterium]
MRNTRAVAFVVALSVLSLGGPRPALAATGDARAGARTVATSTRDAVQWMRERLEDVGAALDGNVRRALADLLAALETVQQHLESLSERTQQELEDAQQVLATRWDELSTALGNAAENSGYTTTGIAIARLAENLMVATRGHVTNADGTPARGVTVVRFATETPVLVGPDTVPTGYAVTDQNGDYTILTPDGLIMAARYALGTAEPLGAAAPPALVIPLELLPATPPYREITYDVQGNATVTAGERPLSVWELMGL